MTIFFKFINKSEALAYAVDEVGRTITTDLKNKLYSKVKISHLPQEYQDSIILGLKEAGWNAELTNFQEMISQNYLGAMTSNTHPVKYLVVSYV